MRFEELLHWNDGQFLQPHHFQYGQRINSEYIRYNRRFFMPYPYGLLDFELDLDALKEMRVVVKRFSAVMSNGQELSMPGNCILKPLDLSEALKNNPAELTVYAAVPEWSEFEANLADENRPMEKKFYLPQKKNVRDENSGDNEITLITRRINARLVTEQDDNKDMRLMPILKLNVVSSDVSKVIINRNEKYIPPFMMLTADDPLFNMAVSLITDLHRCCDKLRSRLDTPTYAPVGDVSFSDVLSEIKSIILLRTLNLYEARLSSFVVDSFITPFDLYIELYSFLSELMGIHPHNSIISVKRYDHEDRLPVFTELFNDILSFIRNEGGVGYIKLNFSKMENSEYLFVPVRAEDIAELNDMYLAVKTTASMPMAVRAVEQGDTFKLVNPSAKSQRIRGIKLSETRYPPRFLPVMDGTLWLKLDIVESAKVWKEMREEKGMIIDYAHDIFPGLEASLFIMTAN
ncbi:MAG: type VI secretion system baseplate subunit TssK [Spirochaetaceae bacterium]|jgi:type VI secretion system ImpJ/VasE family protein|nr:type VI secretion system baseplate subunit TssK [Spirochaetaceae bacterium]